MVITDIRFAFVEIETLADPLAARLTPAMPFSFLLNQGAYESALNDALAMSGPRRVPWHDDFGRKFWFYYLESPPRFYVTFNKAWRALVPLQEATMGTATATWLPEAEIAVRTHLYPWGVAAIIDVHVTGRWSLKKAVELGLQVRSSGKFDWTSGTKAASLSINALMNEVLATTRKRAYGDGAAPGQASEMFSVVTVLDAEKADAETAIDDQSKLHRALDGLVSWSPLWEKVRLDKFDERVISITPKMRVAGHALYGGRRGRAVWFPSGFPSSYEEPKGNLHCYHQNLVASTLQTESLCALARSAAKLIDAGETIGGQSVTYRNCSQLAAGLLGRLHGGNAGTYKSRSVRDQILSGYLTEVNSMRKAFNQSAIQ